MSYVDLVQKAVDYIDNNIEEKISIDELASISGCSKYHFYRVFNSVVGYTMMQYVTKRKLQFALFDLQNGNRVIDVALKYGFETHAGFTKTFKKSFGYPPHLYRLHAPKSLPPKINLQKNIIFNTGGIILQPKIIEKASFKVVGFEFPNNYKNVLRTRDIPAFWSQRGLDDGKSETKLYETLEPPIHGEYCMCIKTNMETDDFSYFLGVGVENFDKATEEMSKMNIPSATYAVFTTPEVEKKDFVKSIQGTWKYILEEWFPTSGYEFDEDKFEYEYYDEHCHPWEYDKISMQIYIPIKVKSN